MAGFPHSSVGKESACNARDPGSIPRLGRSSGEGKGYPLQYSGLENSKDYTVHGVAKSRIRLRDFHFSLFQAHVQFLAYLEDYNMLLNDILLSQSLFCLYCYKKPLC